MKTINTEPNIISFKTSLLEARLIAKIVERAAKLQVGDKNRMACNMDITACHANGNPLELDALLKADDFNFAHDICGIHRHINRSTGKLENCYVPRFSVK